MGRPRGLCPDAHHLQHRVRDVPWAHPRHRFIYRTIHPRPEAASIIGESASDGSRGRSSHRGDSPGVLRGLDHWRATSRQSGRWSCLYRRVFRNCAIGPQRNLARHRQAGCSDPPSVLIQQRAGSRAYGPRWKQKAQAIDLAAPDASTPTHPKLLCLCAPERERSLGRFSCTLQRGSFLNEHKGFFARIPDPIQRANDAHAREESNDN